MHTTVHNRYQLWNPDLGHLDWEQSRAAAVAHAMRYTTCERDPVSPVFITDLMARRGCANLLSVDGETVEVIAHRTL